MWGTLGPVWTKPKWDRGCKKQVNWVRLNGKSWFATILLWRTQNVITLTRYAEELSILAVIMLKTSHKREVID